MTNEFSKPRLSVAGLGISEDARKTMNAAIDAFSDWREEFAEHSEKNARVVFDQMASAAKAFGWPVEFIDATRQQMQNASRMQLHIMDQIMDMWEQQLKNPGSGFKLPEAWTNAMKTMPGMSGMPSFPGMGQMPQFPGFPQFPGMGSFPGMPNFGSLPGMSGMPGNPMQFWMQAAEMWQKAWQDAVKSWMDAQASLTKGK